MSFAVRNPPSENQAIEVLDKANLFRATSQLANTSETLVNKSLAHTKADGISEALSSKPGWQTSMMSLLNTSNVNLEQPPKAKKDNKEKGFTLVVDDPAKVKAMLEEFIRRHCVDGTWSFKGQDSLEGDVTAEELNMSEEELSKLDKGRFPIYVTFKKAFTSEEKKACIEGRVVNGEWHQCCEVVAAQLGARTRTELLIEEHWNYRQSQDLACNEGREKAEENFSDAERARERCLTAVRACTKKAGNYQYCLEKMVGESKCSKRWEQLEQDVKTSEKQLEKSHQKCDEIASEVNSKFQALLMKLGAAGKK